MEITEIIKDKNIINFMLDDGRAYKLNINNGILMGLRDKPLAMCPPAIRAYCHYVARDSIVKNEVSNVVRGLVFLVDTWEVEPRYFYRYPKFFNLLDRYDSVQVKIQGRDQMYGLISDSDIVDKGFARTIPYLKNNGDLYQFVKDERLNAFLQRHGWKIDEHFTRDDAYNLADICTQHFIDFGEEAIHMVLYQYLNGLHEFVSEWRFIEVLKDFFNWSKFLGTPMFVKGNFIKVYTQVRKNYKVAKEVEDCAKLKEWQTSKACLSYEDDNYTVIIPTTSEEFKTEGENQHNCVFSLFLKKCVNGRTHVVFIRDKNNPAQSLVTCEVSECGNIRQYLTKYNETVPSDSALGEFRRKYQTHLLETWESSSSLNG